MTATKIISAEELKKHKTKDSLYVMIHGRVYDVTRFIDEHPGGDEVLMNEAGGDATEAFEDVGHSDEARSLMPEKYIGDIEDGAVVKSGAAAAQEARVSTVVVEQSSNMMYFVPLTALGIYFAYRFYTTGSV